MRFGTLGKVLAVASAVTASVFLSGIGSFADGEGDVTVSVGVIESTPTSLPTKNLVQLQVGQVVTDAAVKIRLTSLEPYSFVQIFAQSEPVLIASGYADKYGIFEILAKLPATLEAGSHQVLAMAQKVGESAPKLESLVQFKVSTDGTITHSSANKGGSAIGGGGTTGGGSGFTESPAPSVSPKPQELLDGVLFVSGTSLNAAPTFDWRGPKATTSFTVMNAYKRAYTLSVRQSVTALGFIPVSGVKFASILNLRPKEAREVTHQIAHIGQWGIYAVDLTVTPPKKLDTLALPVVHRQGLFLVVPALPLTIIGALLGLELLRRFLVAPYLRGRKLLRELLVEPEVTVVE